MENTANVLGVRLVEINDLAPLGHREFESFVGVLLEAANFAFDLERVGGANDQGADLLGKDAFNRPFIVQCKRYFGHPVVPREMRDLLRARSTIYRADIAWFVTTSTFSRGARRAAESLLLGGGVVLADGAKLIDLTHSCWDALPAQWQWRLTECMAKSDQHRREE